jgi:hypothetical protein
MVIDEQMLSNIIGSLIAFFRQMITKKLTLIRKIPFAGANQDEDQMEDCLLHIYNYKPDSMLFNDYQAYPWLQDYAYAFAKSILGEAREKFATISGPTGGTQLNGASLKAESAVEMKDLEQQLKNYIDGSYPLTWVIG